MKPFSKQFTKYFNLNAVDKEKYFVFSFLLPEFSKNWMACLGNEQNAEQNIGFNRIVTKEMTHLCLISATSR